MGSGERKNANVDLSFAALSAAVKMQEFAWGPGLREERFRVATYAPERLSVFDEHWSASGMPDEGEDLFVGIEGALGVGG